MAIMVVKVKYIPYYYQILFQDIDRTKNLEKHKWAGKKTCNVAKNRRKDILPGKWTLFKDIF